MKTMASVVVMLFLLAGTTQADTNPVSKAVELLSSLEAKIISEGESAKKMFEEFSEWCEDTSKTLEYEIKTGKADVADLTAAIEKETALSASLSSKIEELAGSIATAEADLKAATEIRDKEAADFAAEEKELTEVISMLERATMILEKEMAKSGAAFLQTRYTGSIMQAFAAMVQASVFSSADVDRLTAFVQSEQDDSDVGAPDAAVYEGHSDTIIDTLEDLTSKAEAQLAEARKTETQNLHNFELLKQSLEDEMKFDTKDMGESKANLAASGEAKATAEGDLAVTEKDLAEDEASLATTNSDCMQKANNYEAEVASRAEELKALAAAKKVLTEMTGGAQDISYSLSQVSFLQTYSSSHTKMTGSRIVRFIRDLARKQNSAALAQLASRVASSIRLGDDAGDDPFAKVKGLISDMIEKLEGQASADASHKAYCDKELSETTAKKEDKDAEIAKLTSKIDLKSAASAKLKEEVATLQKELAELAATQAEMDKLRAEESEAFKTNSADMKAGIEGVSMALKILREYYGSDDKAHVYAEGAGQGIIGLLEVAQSDFSKGLAEMTVSEQTAAATYEKTTKENAIAKVSKEQSVKYKTQEYTKLDKDLSELSSDREGVMTELAAILDYLKQLNEMCIAKPETYEERKAKRESEIAGLKEALSILESETAFIQRKSAHGLRSVHVHM